MDQDYPYSYRKKIDKKRGFPVFITLLVLFIVSGTAMMAWYFLAPESFARFFGELSGQPLVVESLTVSVDGQSHVLRPSSILDVSPDAKISVDNLKSSRWHNYDLRVYAFDFNINSIIGGASASLSALMGPDSFDDPREVRLEVRDNQHVAAVFTLRAALSAKELVLKGDRSFDPKRKVFYYEKALSLDPQLQGVNEKLIEAAISSGDKKKAVELYEQQVQNNPQATKPLMELLGLYKDLGDRKGKIKTLESLVKLANSRGERQTSYHLELADVFNEAGEWSKAAPLYEDLLKGASNSQSLIYLEKLAVIYNKSHQSSKEIDALQRLVNLVPESRKTTILRQIIGIYAKNGDTQGQVEGWRKLTQLLPPGQDRANAFKQVAVILVQAEKYSEAILAYEEAIKDDKDDINSYINLARLYLKTGNKEKYQTLLTNILEKDPKRLDVRQELADSYYSDKNYKSAEDQYRALLEKKPDDIAMRLRLISILEELKDQNALLEQYSLLVKSQPNDKVAAYNFGVLCFNEKRFDQALKSFKKVLEQDPSDLNTRKYLLAIYKEQGETEKMLKEAIELYRLDPSKEEYLNIVLNHHENAKNWEGFAAAAQEAAKLQANQARSWELMAKADAHLGRKNDQAKHLLKAAEYSKDKVNFLLEAAGIFTSLGDTQKAKETYKKVLELNPGNTEAEDALLDLARKSLEKTSN